MTEEKAAWGYVRLSQESDRSLDQQKQEIRDYCQHNNLTLQTTRNEGANTSGFNPNRDEYQLLRDKIKHNEIDAVVVRDRARLSRDFDDRLELLVDFRASGVEWHVVEAGGRLGVGDVQQAMFECLHAGMDHIKKMIEITRSKEATEERLERGCYQGTPPMGLRFAEDNCHLEKDPEEWARLEEIVRRVRAGESYARVGDRVGVSASTVSRVVGRGLEWYEARLAEYSHGG